MTIEGASRRVPATDFPDLKFERALHESLDVPSDPPTRTPFDVVDESGLLRLRRYRPDNVEANGPPVLLVYSLFKRPYVLDLLPERSIVRNLLAQGFTVYLTDWQAPDAENAERGFDAYVNGDLACAVEYVRTHEGVERVPLIGNCFGGLLALLYAALHPENVARVVPVGAPIELQSPFAPTIVEYVVRMFGNVPGWWIRAWLNAGVPGPAQLSRYVADELQEPALSRTTAGARVARALQPWLESDVPLTGQVFREAMCNAYWNRDLAQGRLRVGGRFAALENIRCPVLNVSGERDRLVPPISSNALVDRLGRDAVTNFVFPATHLGLLLGSAAHAELWPRIGAWLKS
ncbi:MAG: alpha/beta fold hydrolase [Gammaproteobacteria bacterium]